MYDQEIQQRFPTGKRGTPRSVADTIGLFWSKVNKTAGCWVWTGSLRKGYGIVTLSSECQRLLSISTHTIGTHSFSYILAFGTIPKGSVIRHSCDNRACVRPDHLLVGTHADNIADMDSRNRRHTKLTREQVIEIRNRCVILPNGRMASRKELAEEFGVSPSHITWIIKRKTWKNI